MKPNPEELLQGMLQAGQTPSRVVTDSRALVARAETHPALKEGWPILEPYLPAGEDGELTGYLRLALLGVCEGFSDRHLSLHIKEHLEIVPPLLEDIRSVYRQLLALKTPFDRDEFRFRAYDYGIHKAYYLDWRLYLSKELY